MWNPEEELILEGVGLATAPLAPAQRRSTRAESALGWVRERLTTTPGRLVLISALVVVGAVCFGVIATGAEQSRERAVQAARTGTEPLLKHAVDLYTSLSDANATVATGLLAGGLEPAASRNRYLGDIRNATEALTALTRGAGTSVQGSVAIRTVANQLPVYTGLVETARANNRRGFPIGAAYLRQAATLLKTSILPAADRLLGIEAERLNSDYETGTASATLVAIAAAIALGLALLVFAQLYVTRLSHRVFNVLMAVATVALAAVSIWALVGMITAQNALASAQREGSDSVEVLSAANILLSRAQGDLSLTLVNRGTDTTDPLDFKAAMHVLTAPGLPTGLASRFAAYDAAAARVQNQELGGQLETAINSDQRPGGVASVSQQLSDQVSGQIAAAQARFARHARDAASALDGLGLAIPLVTALVAILALLGLRQRIIEYR
jgi:hypothetical protein